MRQRIQLTATTPSNSAVRLETGLVELELSNRVQNVPAHAHDARLFARAHVDLNLSLGQLIRNAMFDEAEPEFQQYAFFNTRIGTCLLCDCGLGHLVLDFGQLFDEADPEIQ